MVYTLAANRGAILRAQVARIVVSVVTQGRSIDNECDRELSDFSSSEQALAREMAFGTVRWYDYLVAVVEQMTGKPSTKLKAPVRALVICGLYQLWKMRVAPHAAVSETVNAVTVLKAPRLKGLVNALLRRFQREQEVLLAKPKVVAREHAHPRWLHAAITNDWPNEAAAIFAANNERAPMWLRVNQQRASISDYQQRLKDAHPDVETHTNALLPNAIMLAKPLPVTTLPGWETGDVSVQDAAAQLVVDFVAPCAGERILDACAAPGGKTAHLLERTGGDIALTALDNDARRLGDVEATLTRIGYKAVTQAASAQELDSWWDGQAFDRILIDAPCSASGVIRRHPDIKFTRRPADLGRLARTQRNILAALWPALKPGGRLVYATCSIFSQENTESVNEFLTNHSNANVIIQLPNTGWQALMQRRGAGYQVLPGTQNLDGFYYACIEKSL